MPLFYQHNINDHTKLAIWKIEEDESFFSEKIPLQREISHPHKRLQHLAGRYLLQYLFPEFPYELLVIADTRKPYLSNEAYHFSISHCNDYAAAIVSSENRVGVDIELVRQQINNIKNKFLAEREWTVLSASNLGISKLADEAVPLTMAWSSKEAVYKWYGYGGVDFKKHMTLKRIDRSNDDWIQSEFLFCKENEVSLELHCRFFDELVLAFVVT